MKKEETKELFDKLYFKYLKQIKLLPTKSAIEKASKDLNFNFANLIDDSFSKRYNKNEMYVFEKAEETINKLLDVDVYESNDKSKVTVDKLYLPTDYYDKMIIGGFVCYYHITTKKGNIFFKREMMLDEITHALKENMTQYIDDAYDEAMVRYIEENNIRINISEDNLPMTVLSNTIMDIIVKHQTEIVCELMNNEEEPLDINEFLNGRGCS